MGWMEIIISAALVVVGLVGREIYTLFRNLRDDTVESKDAAIQAKDATLETKDAELSLYKTIIAQAPLTQNIDFGQLFKEMRKNIPGHRENTHGSTEEGLASSGLERLHFRFGLAVGLHVAHAAAADPETKDALKNITNELIDFDQPIRLVEKMVTMGYVDSFEAEDPEIVKKIFLDIAQPFSGPKG